MSKKARLALLIRLAMVALLAAPATDTVAEPILLAGFSQGGTSNMSENLGTQPAPDITGARFNLSFRSSPTTGATALFGPATYPYDSGLLVPTGGSGVFDFAAANAPGFAAVSSVLTSGNDEFIEFDVSLDADGEPQGGFGAGGLESSVFGGLLAGDTIDFLRLIVAVNVVSYTTEPQGLTLWYGPTLQWQVWGTGPTLLPAPRTLTIPEPDTLLLLVMGLFLLIALQRRHARDLVIHACPKAITAHTPCGLAHRAPG